MTPLALHMEAAPARRERRLRRAPLAIKLAIAFLGLVALVLIVNGAIDTYLTYYQAKRAALEVQAEKARGAAERVSAFLADIQTQLGWTTGVEWGYSKLEQQRYDFIRLLRQAPAITALAYIDGHGREQIAVSRLEPDSIASGKDFSADPRFTRAVAEKIWLGPVEFRRGSEPYMTIALAHVGKTPGVTVADVNLKLVWDVVSAIHVGAKGFAYVVDDHGRLIAHPDLSLVLRDSDFSALPQVAEAMKAQSGGSAAVAKSLDGGAVLTAFAIEPKTHWAVFVEQPLSEALAAAYATLARAAGLLGLGLLLAAVTGVALARRMAAPIRQLQAGAEKLGAGDLTQRLDIRSGDEIEALAGGFNRMAERLQESYENLEGKVEARTRDLGMALERQTATSDILRVISQSPTDAKPVFESIVSAAARLLRCDMAFVMLVDGKSWWNAATATPAGLEKVVLTDKFPVDPGANFPSRAIIDKTIVHLPDWSQIELPEHQKRVRSLFEIAASLHLPFLREGECVGVLTLLSRRAHAFGAAEIAQAEAFRDQALIAIENARLFNETQEALKQQTATADVLKVISRSVFDLDTVLQTLIDTAVRLTRGSRGTIFLRQDDVLIARAFHSNVPDELRAYLATTTWRVDGDSHMARAVRERAIVHISDLSQSQIVSDREVQKRASFGAGLWTPLMRQGEVVGVFGVPRDEPIAFSNREIELVQTFADQAVIAIENARLFAELQARTRDLSEALQQQTATADVLKAISRSVFDLESVLRTLIDTAVRLCRGSRGTIFIRNGDRVEARAFHSHVPPGLRDFLLQNPISLDDEGFIAASIREGRRIHHADLVTDRALVPERARAEAAFGAVLCVPLMREGEAIGCFAVPREAPQAFSAREIELVETFADQAVIAIENTRLFEEVQSRTRELAASLDDLRKAQDRLIQSEKLASLGQLTAGIAHEIKNPLNFVNNFSGLSRELLDEISELLTKSNLAEAERQDIEELIGMVNSNLDKVVTHGKRADSIVKNMLLHSREGSGTQASVNVNALVEEALNLAWHGARAEKPGFQATIEKSLDPKAGAADLYPQEMSRVLLNLISNGFYATTKRRLNGAEEAYEPTVTASTRDHGDRIEIAIRDNGTGIPEEVKAKIFNPFFTTKPAGEGTGLGLSLSHDIVVKQHGGTLEVATEPGVYTQFTIVLPRANRSQEAVSIQ